MGRKINGLTDEHGFFYIMSSVTNNGNTVDNIKTIIDTGAANTHIHPELAKGLKLDIIDESISINPIKGEEVVKRYEIDILINKIRIPSIRVKEFTALDYPCGIILGIDIIKHCDFQYEALTKTFSLTIFPNHYN
jgi:predicted aspartyl protease